KVALPSGAGTEAAGVVEAVGAGVAHIKPGDRVAYAGGPLGAYAEVRNMPADRLCVLPDGISFEHAAAMMLKGLTVHYLIRRTHRVTAGETVLFHAAAGGVGLIACQWLRALGVAVIGTAGTDERCALALRHGAAHCINYTTERVPDGVRAITRGAGVPVVYDSVGKDTFVDSLDCLRPFGMLVSFGNSSGPVTPFPLGILAEKGSLYVTRPTLGTYVAARSDLDAAAAELFGVVLAGQVTIEIGQRYALEDAAAAHRAIAARKTTGSTILIP
ncbi:MAG TPA: quinone oxidoreductase, partial [Gemmatimonadaceae bacterium]|nr:quinone oxidoreductase [Gemmatimonadaceae bacterium]